MPEKKVVVLLGNPTSAGAVLAETLNDLVFQGKVGVVVDFLPGSGLRSHLVVWPERLLYLQTIGRLSLDHLLKTCHFKDYDFFAFNSMEDYSDWQELFEAVCSSDRRCDLFLSFLGANTDESLDFVRDHRNTNLTVIKVPDMKVRPVLKITAANSFERLMSTLEVEEDSERETLERQKEVDKDWFAIGRVFPSPWPRDPRKTDLLHRVQWLAINNTKVKWVSSLSHLCLRPSSEIVAWKSHPLVQKSLLDIKEMRAEEELFSQVFIRRFSLICESEAELQGE